NQAERPIDTRWPPAGSTRLDREVWRSQRVVEVGRAEAEAPAPPNCVTPPLDLVVGDVDALLGEPAQGALDALGGDQRPNVAQLAASLSQQRQVRAARLAVDGSFDGGQEALFAARQPFGQARLGHLKGDRLTQEPGDLP